MWNIQNHKIGKCGFKFPEDTQEGDTLHKSTYAFIYST